MRPPPRPFRISNTVGLAAFLFLALLTAARSAHAGSARLSPPCVTVASLIGPARGSGSQIAGEDSQEGQNNDPAGQAATPVSQPRPAKQLGQDVCVAAHVYQVVELRDGTRFLDVCPAATPDEDCRFILLSRRIDREEVGDLRRLSGAQVQVRGRLTQINGRFAIFISHSRQLDGGPEKFRPNPRLLQDFDPDSDRLAVRDPNLHASGRRRAFMNRNIREHSAP